MILNLKVLPDHWCYGIPTHALSANINSARKASKARKARKALRQNRVLQTKHAYDKNAYMPLKVVFIQVMDVNRVYDVFYRVSGLPSLGESKETKARFLAHYKSAEKPIHAIYPLGILSLAAYVRKKLGDQVELHVIDMLQKRYTFDDVMEELDRVSPDVVGLSAFSFSSSAVHTLASRIKDRDLKCIVIAGGAYCSASIERAAEDPNVDCAVYGEGEETLVEILRCVLKRKPFTGLLGTAHFEYNGVIVNRPRPVIKDLDSLPYPATDLIDVPGYWGNISPLGVPGPWMILFNSRGCPYHCIYCHRIFGKRTRFMSPKRTFNEIMHYHKKYGISEFQIWDDIFNLNVKRGIELCQMISKKKKDFRFLFLGGLRADIMQKKLLDRMIQAGCCYICYAVESASPRIQKLINKNLKLKKAAEAIDFTADAGVWVNTYNMLGFPTETKEEMKKTLDYNIALRHNSVRIFKVIPQEGTVLYDMIASQKKAKTGETSYYVDYDELYSDGVSKDEFEDLLRYGWHEFYFSKERLERILSKKSPVLSPSKIKHMYGLELLGVMMRCGIRDVSELPPQIRPLAKQIMSSVVLPPLS